MSDEKPEVENTTGNIDQIKAEIDQKLSSVSSQLQNMNETFNKQLGAFASAIQQQMSSVKKPEPTEKENFDDMSVAEFEERIVKKADELATKRAQEIAMKAQEKQQTLYSLSNEYPEMLDSSSDFTKKLLDIHASLPDNLKDTSAGYKLAAREAAAELGILPKSKRATQSNEGFSLGGSATANRPKKEEAVELTENQKAFAKLLGRDINDKGFKERIKQALNRPYGKWR